jgi:futalosine hydrolase
MKVVITAATTHEWMHCFQTINSIAKNKRPTIFFHCSGVGMLSTSFSLTKLIAEKKPNLIIQAGIAGTFNTKTLLGKVVAIKDELLADMGVEENDEWKDIFDLNLESKNAFPFTKKKLINHHIKELNFLKLKEVSSITVNEITTNKKRTEQLIKKYKPQIESMEGAALHYTCLQTNTAFIQIRSISNYIGERNKANWKIKEAITNLNETLLSYIETLQAHQ